MTFKTWQLWGLIPMTLSGMLFYSSLRQPKQAEAMLPSTNTHISLTPQELIEQRLKQSPVPKVGLPKAAPGVTLTTLYRFKGSDGKHPTAGLNYIDNTFYGTTSRGGANDFGTIFKLTPAGHILTTLHSFNDVDGAYPSARLIRDKDGNFYGTTSGGGAYGHGTVFQLSSNGTLTTLHSFYGKGVEAYPVGQLIRTKAGYLFGITAGTGATHGSVFRLSPDGNLKVLHRFNGRDGDSPYNLIRGLDGDFYGMTFGGGASNVGTIFKLTPNGALTTLHNFRGSDGSAPYRGVIQGLDGSLYGTTSHGGANRIHGTVFKLIPNGALTTLHSFNGSDGSFPRDGLIKDSVGNLYGTTISGGVNNKGTIFRISTDGTFTSLYSFSGLGVGVNDVRLFKGALYGTTFYRARSGSTCHPYGCGTIFKLSISPSTPVRKHSHQPMMQALPSNPNG